MEERSTAAAIFRGAWQSHQLLLCSKYNGVIGTVEPDLNRKVSICAGVILVLAMNRLLRVRSDEVQRQLGFVGVVRDVAGVAADGQRRPASRQALAARIIPVPDRSRGTEKCRLGGGYANVKRMDWELLRQRFRDELTGLVEGDVDDIVEALQTIVEQLLDAKSRHQAEQL